VSIHIVPPAGSNRLMPELRVSLFRDPVLLFPLSMPMSAERILVSAS
jgi:hypothetical protein